jgi:uncharacterized membrane protein
MSSATTATTNSSSNVDGGARHRRGGGGGGTGQTPPSRLEDNDLTEPLSGGDGIALPPLYEGDTAATPVHHHESHTRSIVKGLTWRVVATSTTTLIAWMITGEVDMALKIGFFEFFAKLFIYYAHERIWIQCIPLR